MSELTVEGIIRFVLWIYYSHPYKVNSTQILKNEEGKCFNGIASNEREWNTTLLVQVQRDKLITQTILNTNY